MNIRKTDLEGLLILEPKIFTDSRGYFIETFRHEFFSGNEIECQLIQDNQSRSEFGVIRGLHFQREPFAQAKLVRVIEGVIFDVALDIRKDSPTYGKWFGLEISADNYLQLLIPKGFAHGFSVLSSHATVLYKCDAYYNPESEGGIRYDDPDLSIDWRVPAESALVSEKDLKLPFLNQIT